MATTVVSGELQRQLDEFYELLGRARKLFPAAVVPPPTVVAGVVHDGKWVR